MPANGGTAIVYNEADTPFLWAVNVFGGGYLCRIWELNNADLRRLAKGRMNPADLRDKTHAEATFTDIEDARQYFATDDDLAFQGEALRLFRTIDPVHYAE